MKKVTLIPLIFIIFFFTSCGKEKLPVEILTITRADGTTITVEAEIAATEETRNFGYMERKNIPDGTGMIFIFEQEQILSFWMKNTPHPLSIAYIDSKGKIRDILDMTPFSLESVKSSSSVKYALEVPQGWYNKNEIKKGDFVSLPSIK